MISKRTYYCISLIVALGLIFTSAFYVKPSAAASWEEIKANWKEVEKKGKQEGKVTTYHGLTAPIRDALEKAWAQLYPDIEWESISGRGAQQLERIKAEQRSKNYVADVYMNPPESQWAFRDAGVLQKSYPGDVLPVLNDPGIKWMKEPVVDPDGYYFAGYRIGFSTMLINTDRVPADKEPTQWKDLLDPWWKGKDKILFRDPTQMGGAGNWLVIMYHKYGEDFIKAIAAQDPTVMSIGGSQALALVSRGEYAALMVADYAEGIFVPEGTPIKPCTMRDGHPGGMGQAWSMVKNAPHPNAALVFGNFLLSQEAQAALASVNEGVSRGDVPLPHPEFQDLSKVNAPIIMMTEEIYKKAPEIWKAAKVWFNR